ncbi:MAG: hypothetical protein ACLFR8_03685 [Alkalispirochaeta sp.]
MNKRINTVLFIIGATIFNIIAMVVIFFVLMVVFARFIAPSLPPGANQIILLVLFVASVAATYLIYHRLMRWLVVKYDLEAYMSPLFGKKK